MTQQQHFLMKAHTLVEHFLLALSKKEKCTQLKLMEQFRQAKFKVHKHLGALFKMQ